MKCLILVIILNTTAFAINYAQSETAHFKYQDLKPANATSDLFFEQFKKSLNRVYDNQRAKIDLYKSLDFIAKHNQLYDSGYVSHRLAANQFAGLTNDDLPKTKFKRIDNQLSVKNNEQITSQIYGVPNNFDWRQMGKVTKAKNQMSCNCCYAFTVIATIESAVAIRDNLTIDLFEDNSPQDLSAQQIVDCSQTTKYLNKGCQYGFIDDSFKYVIDNGVVSEQHYPFKHYEQSCSLETISQNRTFIADFIGMPAQSVEHIKRIIISKGPVIALINNDGLDFLYYDHGIIRTEAKTDGQLNHAVVIVGWGQQNHSKYWIIKNSWGEDWGENGFARIEFGVRGVDKYIYYPILDNSGQVDIYNRILIFVFIVLAILMFVSVIAILMYCCDQRGKLAFKKRKVHFQKFNA